MAKQTDKQARELKELEFTGSLAEKMAIHRSILAGMTPAERKQSDRASAIENDEVWRDANGLPPKPRRKRNH